MHIQRTTRKTERKEAFHFYWNRERKKTPVSFLMTLTVALISRANMYWKVILGSLAIDVPRKWRHRITPLNFLFFLSANKVFNVSLWKRNSRSLLVLYFFKITSLLKDFFTFVYCNTLNSKYTSFLTRELRACASASCRYDVENGIRSLARSVDSCKLFFDFRLLSAFDSFWRATNKRNGDLCC